MEKDTVESSGSLELGYDGPYGTGRHTRIRSLSIILPQYLVPTSLHSSSFNMAATSFDPSWRFVLCTLLPLTAA